MKEKKEEKKTKGEHMKNIKFTSEGIKFEQKNPFNTGNPIILVLFLLEMKR